MKEVQEADKAIMEFLIAFLSLYGIDVVFGCTCTNTTDYNHMLVNGSSCRVLGADHVPDTV